MKSEEIIDACLRNLIKKFPGHEVLYSYVDESGCTLRLHLPCGNIVEGSCKMGKNQNTPFLRECRKLGFLKELLRKNYRGKNSK